MTFTTLQEAQTRAQFIDKMIKQIAPEKYVMKQAVAIIPTDAWTNYFWREKRTVLTAGSTQSVSGIPRLAEFPQASAEWERQDTILSKYGLEENISWEDIRTSEIDVLTRTSIKIAEGVAYQVDRVIYNGLAGDGDIQSVTITDGATWNASSAAILDNLFEAAEKFKDYNLPTGQIYCFVSPRDKRSIMNYMAEKGAQWMNMSEGIALTGAIGKLAGMTLIESKAVSASEALVVIPKRCGTWRENQGLTTTTKEDPYKSLTIRAVEMGTLQVHEPKAIVKIINTQT